jgi:hypothetical protein
MKLLLARQDPFVTGTSRRFRDILCRLFNGDSPEKHWISTGLRMVGAVLVPLALYLPRSGIR